MPIGPNYPYMQQSWQPYQQQSFSMPQQQPQNTNNMIWVDGEVGAKAYQLPVGWPVGTPIALWDTNDTVIYLKSINQMGMPNPIQRIHYTMEEPQNMSKLPGGQMSGQENVNYATKSDLERLRDELWEMFKNQQPQTNQNGSNNGQVSSNRGGNR